MMLFGMMHGQPHVQLVQSAFQYQPLRRESSVYANEILAAVGDRDEEGRDPLFCVLAASKFQWGKSKDPRQFDTGSDIHTF